MAQEDCPIGQVWQGPGPTDCADPSTQQDKQGCTAANQPTCPSGYIANCLPSGTWQCAPYGNPPPKEKTRLTDCAKKGGTYHPDTDTCDTDSGDTEGDGGTKAVTGQGSLFNSPEFLALLKEMARQSRLDTLTKQFSFERATQKYGESLPMEQYLKDFYAENILGVKFQNPEMSKPLSSFLNNALDWSQFQIGPDGLPVPGSADPNADLTLPSFVGGGYSQTGDSLNPVNPQSWSLLAAPAAKIGGDLNANLRDLREALPMGGGDYARLAGSAVNRSYGNVAALRAGQVSDALSYLSNLTKENKFGIPVGEQTGAGQGLLSYFGGQQNTDKQIAYNYASLAQNQKQFESSQSSNLWGGLFNMLGKFAAGAA